MVYYIVSGLFLMFFWYPCMAINVNVQYNGGLLPDIILSVDPMLSASGNMFKCHEEILYLQPLTPPKRFEFFSPITGGCSEGLGVLRFFFTHKSYFGKNRTYAFRTINTSRCAGYLLDHSATGYFESRLFNFIYYFFLSVLPFSHYFVCYS